MNRTRNHVIHRGIVCILLLIFASHEFGSVIAQELASSVEPPTSALSPASSISVDDVKPDVSELLKMLDSPKYAEREAATALLSNMGVETLRPMAIHYLKSSPEASWRITRSLEQMATNGDEETFLKAVAMLQLLVGNNSDEVEAQLMRLKFEWSTKQTVNAVKTLESAGAKIENISTVSGPQALRNWISKQNALAEASSKKPTPAASMSRPERIKMIDGILKGSLQDNRKLVLGNKLKKPTRTKSAQEAFNVLERQLADQIVIRNGAMIEVNNNSGVTAKFDSTWEGNKAQFRELENVDALTNVSLTKQYVDRAKLETLNNLPSLTTLEFVKCRFSGPALATVGLPKTIEDLRLREQDVELSTIDRIAKLPIKSLVFDDCKFSKTAMKRMLSFDTLGSLELAKMDLDENVFRRLEDMKTLRSLKLSGCKYPFPAYKRLAKLRPDIYVEFTTTAFLGVRSVPGESRCVISDVVPDSAAEKAGVQPEDMIVEVNGYEISEFNDLRAHIALHKPGDDLRLSIVRNGADVKLTVKLGDYEDAPPR